MQRPPLAALAGQPTPLRGTRGRTRGATEAATNSTEEASALTTIIHDPELIAEIAAADVT